MNSYPAGAITVPTLSVHTKDDTLVVSYHAAQRAADRIPAPG